MKKIYEAEWELMPAHNTHKAVLLNAANLLCDLRACPAKNLLQSYKFKYKYKMNICINCIKHDFNIHLLVLTLEV